MARISYSQFSQWVKCPHKWKLEYIEMFLLTEGGMYELAELFKKYGTEPKEIKKLGLPIQ